MRKRGSSWFARHKGLARQYAQTRARQRHDDPAILECDDPAILECDVSTSDVQKKEDFRIASARGSVVVIQGRIPGKGVSNRRMLGFFWSANEVAAWTNGYPGLKGAQRISPGHPGVQRLRKWMGGTIRRRTTPAGPREETSPVCDSLASGVFLPIGSAARPIWTEEETQVRDRNAP